MELSTLIDVFEGYLEEHLDGENELLPEELPDEIVDLIDTPQALDALVGMGISCPYEVETDEFQELLRWLEISAINFAPLKRMNPALFNEFAEQISDGLIFAVEDEEIDPEQLYAVVRTLKGQQIPVSDLVMEWLHVHHEPAQDENINVEELISAMLQGIRSSGIHNAQGFVFMMETELAMLPAPGLENMLEALSAFDWYIDAAVMLLSHHEPVLVQQAQSFLACVPDKEWGKLTNSGYLTVLRHFVSDELKTQIDYWQRQVLRHHKPKVQKASVVEVLATMPDGLGGTILTALVKDNSGYAVWNGMIRLDMGIAESVYRPLDTKAEWLSLKQKIMADADAYAVDPVFIKNVLPWMLTINQKSQTPLDISALFFLTMLPAEWAKPQPAKLSDIIGSRLGHPDTSVVEHARSLSDSLLIHPAVNTWFETSLPTGCKTPRDVINKVFLEDRTVLAKRMVFSGLLCHFATKEEGISKHEEIFLLNAYDILNNSFSRKKLPLLQVLAKRSLEAVKHEQNMLAAIEIMAEPDVGYVLKVELDHTRPMVWRRLNISSKTSLIDLHIMIQIAMGWDDSHLFQFESGDESYPAGDEENGYEQLEDIMVGMLLREPGEKLQYIYDFGDYWEHTITLEKVQKKRCLTPKVTAGSRCCPPEDCGGIPGYETLLKALKRRSDDDLELLEWSGWDDEDFDPKAWDKERVNSQLRDF